MWGPQDSVQLVNITPITMVYGTYNELVSGANLNQQTSLGGGHIVASRVKTDLNLLQLRSVDIGVQTFGPDYHVVSWNLSYSMAISGFDWLEVPTIYKGYFSGLCKGIYPQNMTLYGTVPPF